MENPETTTIYTLSDPTTGFVKYVGKSNNPKARLGGHISDTRKTARRSWIISLKRKGILPTMEILEEVPYDTWAEAEKFWIENFRFLGFNLTNLTIGGDGANGYRCSEAAIKKRKERKVSIETKKKLSFVKKGKKPANYEIFMTYVKGQRGKKKAPFTLAHRLAMSLAHKGVKRSLKERQAISEGWAKRTANLCGKQQKEIKL